MIQIPKKFLDILMQSDACDMAVKQTLINVRPILEDNKLEFFPEYTNHGERHIISVLEIAERMIEEKTFEKLESIDIEVLISSILMHDIGMHISYSGFINLITEKRFDSENVYNDLPWAELWEDYFKEAIKWNQEKRENVFGEDVEVKEIPQDEKYATKVDKLLIGEFLRRYHHKLAYDIAVNGFPGNKNVIECLKVSDDNLREIVGHIARSHGMGLWEMVDYLNKLYGNPRAVVNVKVIYHMAVLRLADYFDMDKTRANKVIWNIKKIDSSISQKEWEQHNCIEGIEFDYQDDSESLYIRLATPKSSYMFLKVETFICKLQDELDTTWAVIGKMYNRYGDLKLKFRRIYSNIGIIRKGVRYVTEKVTFDVNRNILFYLAQPLYGKNPSYGIRELIQNASDACRERKVLNTEGYIPKVTIEIKEEDKKYFIIKDNGIGMTKDVIINYFLVAGSSFRNDSEWKKRFILKKESIVVRNGKFGIGVVSAFLLGNNVSVETTSVDEAITYNFEATLNTQQIELLFCQNRNAQPGTIIKIELNEDIYNILKKQWCDGWTNSYTYRYWESANRVPWNEWYQADDLIVEVHVPSEWKRKVEKKKEKKWRVFKTSDYGEVNWTYDMLSDRYRLICNGIIIPLAYELKNYCFPRDVRIPLVSITDKNGKLPLNLSRNSIEDNCLPFERELMKEIYMDMLDVLENNTDVGLWSESSLKVNDAYLAHPSIGTTYAYEYNYGMRPEEVIYNREGYCLCYDYFLQRLKSKKISKVWIERDMEIIEAKLLTILGENIVVSQRDLPNSIDSYKYCLDNNGMKALGAMYNFVVNYFIMKKSKFDYLFECGKNRIRQGFLQEFEKISENEEWICFGRKGVQERIKVDELGNLSKICLMIQYEYERICDLDNYPEKSLLFNNLLEEKYGGKVFIPYKN